MSRLDWLDVSEHNAVNWDAVEADFKAGNLGGVFIRASYGTATGAQVDAKLASNRDQARSRSVPRGFYHFAYPGRSSGAVQAAGFAACVGQLQPGESTALDMEDEGTYGRLLVASDVGWADEWEAKVTELMGPIPGSYMNSNVLGRYDWGPLVRRNSWLWLANYGPNDGQFHGFADDQEWSLLAFQQYTSRGNLGGTNPVDVSRLNSDDPNAALKFGLQGSAPAVPAPDPTPAPPVAGLGTSYVLGKAVPGYVSSTDAAKGQNSNSTVPAGTYYVFNQASGMVNITRQPGVPGWWINPASNSAPAAAASGNFVVVKDLPGFYTAAEAASHSGQDNTIHPGNYFVFNTYNGMVNVTTKQGVPGTWINPADNAGAPQNIPAPASHTVVRGDTVEGISKANGLSLDNNYAQFRALNPSSGHGGDWTNLWPGDVVRVR